MAEGRVGRYALVKMIGRGGMADVWIGKVQGASGFEKIVAIKLLSPDQVDKEEYQRALTDEARVQVHLKHPNIVDVYDLNFEAENPYLVMEYVEGIELREVLRHLRYEKVILPASLSAYIVLEIAKALHFAHERLNPETGEPLHIVHRDVSPSNILLSIHGDVKLSDFGIAKSSLQSAATQIGQIKGKFRYMSPEQAEGRPLDARSDIFSLGLILYECLFGTPAYDDPSDIGLLQKARTAQVSLAPKMDPELQGILEKLMGRRPEDRYSDLRPFIRDLSDYFKKMPDGMGNRETLEDYLKGLNIRRLKEVSTAKALAEHWVPEATAQILEETGRIVTLAEDVSGKVRPRNKWAWGIGAVALVGAVSLLGWMTLKEEARNPTASVQASPAVPSVSASVSGSLNVEVVPADALVKIQYGDVTLTRPAPVQLTDAPLNMPIEVSASKKGFQTVAQKVTLTADKNAEDLKLALKEIQGAQVSFSADPYAEVSIPGLVTNRETPFARTLPPGEYAVTFRHGATGKIASTRLKAANGGAFLCAANMAVTDPSAVASASCRSR